MSAHSPAPWTYGVDHAEPNVVNTGTVRDAEGRLVAAHVREGDDARLIAAAPELLEMLSLYVASEIACGGACSDRSERCVDCSARDLLKRVRGGPATK